MISLLILGKAFLFQPSIIFKRNRKTEKKKKKASALVAWQRLQGGTE
jgi:hypothetical protein